MLPEHHYEARLGRGHPPCVLSLILPPPTHLVGIPAPKSKY